MGFTPTVPDVEKNSAGRELSRTAAFLFETGARRGARAEHLQECRILQALLAQWV